MSSTSDIGYLISFLVVGLLTLAAGIAIFIWARRASRQDRIGDLGTAVASVLATVLLLGGGLSLGLAIITGACGAMTFH